MISLDRKPHRKIQFRDLPTEGLRSLHDVGHRMRGTLRDQDFPLFAVENGANRQGAGFDLRGLPLQSKFGTGDCRP